MSGSTVVRRGDYRPPAFLVDRVDLVFDLEADRTIVVARLALRRNPDHDDPRAPLRLDGHGLELLAVRLDGRPLAGSAWQHDADGLTVPGVPDTFELATEVAVHPAGNTALMGLYASEGLLCTQCEPEAFRRITFFPDRPDVLARFTTTLIADAARYPVLLGNGNPVRRETLADGRHCVVWEDPHPKPSYLFALVAGRLECVTAPFTTGSGRVVTVAVHTEPGCAEHGRYALETVCWAMAWDERQYGREYDLDVFNLVAVSQYTMGAMENKGLNIFNDRYVLIDPETATDADRREVEAMVAHEFLHNWSGNRVTCRDWFQLAIKEGFTVFREQQFVADRNGADVRRLRDARLIHERQFAEDAGPLAHAVRPDHYTEIENFYTDTVYSKGAEIVRMMSGELGTDGFRAGVDAFFVRHDGHAVTVEDFIETLSEAGGRDLSPYIRWYDRIGTTELTVQTAFNAARGHLDVTATQFGRGAPVPIPIELRLLGEDGAPLPARLEGGAGSASADHRLRLDRRQDHWRFIRVDRAPVISPLRGFSAPVRLVGTQTTQALAVIAMHEDDAYARWAALQALAEQAVKARLRGRADVGAEIAWSRAVGPVLVSTPSAVAAEILRPPALMALLMRLPGTDLDRLTAALGDWRAEIGGRLSDRLDDVLDRMAREDSPAARALAAVAFDYRAAAWRERGLDLCRERYRSARTMTEMLAALEPLAASDEAQDRAALADFRQRWQGHPRVLDRWFAVQARSVHPQAADRVRALMDDPAFSLSSPNRVRALIGTFAEENPRGFHSADGRGYRLLADCLRRIDADNPALAASLARAFTMAVGLDRARSAQLRAECDRLAATPGVSAALAEVVGGGARP